MDKKEVKKILLAVSGCFLSSAIITGIDEYRKRKALKESLEKTRKNLESNNSKFSDPFDSTKWFEELNKIFAEDNKKQALKNEARLVKYLYAVIKQRKTLMKSEQDHLLAMVRTNKLVESKDIDLDKCSDQDLLKYLETKCKFDIFDDFPKLTSQMKNVTFHNLKELGIDSIV